MRHFAYVHKWLLLWRNQRAAILPTTLIFLGVLVLLGTTAFVMSTTETRIGRNHMTGTQAFYAAVAGCEEARARLAEAAVNPVLDNSPAQAAWRAYIGGPQRVQRLGYDHTDSRHQRYDSLSGALQCAVEIRHAGKGTGCPQFWGDRDGDGRFERNTVTGKVIYQVTSLAFVQGSLGKVQTEIAEIPSISVPAALYVEEPSLVQGPSTYVIGVAGCSGLPKPGIVTPQSSGSITILGGAQVTGAGGGTPSVSYNCTDVDVDALIRFFSKRADVLYSVMAATHSPTSVPGPGDGWGMPIPGATLQHPTSCSSSIVVCYDTGCTYVKLSNGVQGCGMLLVKGDLELEGDFYWHGPIIVSGSVIFSGGGDRNITGAVISGGSVICGISAGNSNIIYCAPAVEAQSEDRPLQLLTWKAGG